MKLTTASIIPSLICLWLSALLSLESAEPITERTMDTMFSEANQQFEQANTSAMLSPSKAQTLYNEAILKYQYITENAQDPAAEIYLNLGNAYFLAGENGLAALNYQRALRLEPTQADALHNLRYLRSVNIDELPLSKYQRLGRALLFWHHWPASIRIALLALSNIVFWGILARLLYQKKTRLWMALSASAALTLTFTLSLLINQLGWDQDVDGVITNREVIARQGNGYIYDNAFTSPLHPGTEFSVLETRGEWLHVCLLNGKSCWIPVNSSTLVQP